MRWWRLGLGATLLLWVLGAAYQRARRRGRDVGLAVLLVGSGVILFAAAVFVPRPPMSPSIASLLVVTSVMLMGMAMAVLLWRGFRE